MILRKSESIESLAVALVKFNGEVSKIAKDAENPFFKNNYATLDTIIDEVRPILQKNGLSVMQIPSGDGQNISMKTLLIHESGQWIESDELVMKPVKNDPQAVGSAITYARRYSIGAFLSLNTGEDDDGNIATGNDKEPPGTEKTKLTEKQVGRLFGIAKDNGYEVGRVKAKIIAEYKVKDVADLSKAQYDKICASMEANPKK